MLCRVGAGAKIGIPSAPLKSNPDNFSTLWANLPAVFAYVDALKKSGSTPRLSRNSSKPTNACRRLLRLREVFMRKLLLCSLFTLTLAVSPGVLAQTQEAVH